MSVAIVRLYILFRVALIPWVAPNGALLLCLLLVLVVLNFSTGWLAWLCLNRMKIGNWQMNEQPIRLVPVAANNLIKSLNKYRDSGVYTRWRRLYSCLYTKLAFI